MYHQLLVGLNKVLPAGLRPDGCQVYGGFSLCGISSAFRAQIAPKISGMPSFLDHNCQGGKADHGAHGNHDCNGAPGIHVNHGGF